MEITKPNDIFVATLNNPNATTYDFMSAQLNPTNTSLFLKEEYKDSDFVKNKFKTEDGKFDDVAFDNFYAKAKNHYEEMTNEDYIRSLDQVQYSPFDVTRPKDAKVFKVDVEFSKDINPLRELYSRTAINSIDSNTLSLREIAQQGKIFNPKTKTWSEESVNDLSILDKFFGDTLVYAQWDDEGRHLDPNSGLMVDHKKGDWKISPEGNLFVEKLAGREIYGKQVVNPMDLLTTDGSFANKFDFFDADSKEKSALKTTIKIAADIAPFLIPGVAPVYGGVKAAIGLASVMPTFFKSLEGILLGDSTDGLANNLTAAEGYMAKFAATSISDAAQGSLLNYEQMSGMVGSIFSQIYEQRAMAGLAKIFTAGQRAKLTAKQVEYQKFINKSIIDDIAAGKINFKTDDVSGIARAAMAKVPELKELEKLTSGMSKAFSLGYMALTSTGDIYGQALQGGYDRRTAGFVALVAAAGQYGVMMNNQMGTWFLDKSTGYTVDSNKALIRKTIKEYLKPIQDDLNKFPGNPVAAKKGLANTVKSFKNKLYDTFTSPSELGEAMFKNAFIEGVEEVTEQAVLDATKGITDVMSYLGLTKQKGTFGGLGTVFSKEGLENYIANFVGGVLGGAMFEFNRRKIDPWVHNDVLLEDTKQSIYQLVANGETQLLIDEINRTRPNLGNRYLSPLNNDPINKPGQEISQADLVADMAIQMVRNIDGVMNAKGLAVSDKDIIKKAMLDHKIINDLEKSKGTGNIGIEGTVVDTFRNAASNIMRIDADIKKLSATDEDKEKNKEAIKELREESKIYEQIISDIKEGKNAEKYFTEAIFYLSKQLSEPWLNIDRNSYSKAVYGKNYNDLKDSGIGITKEKVNKEWKEHLDSKDLRKSISVITAAYLEYEKQINPFIDKYTADGYSEERGKTLKNVLDIASTIRLFDVSTEKTSKQTIKHYIDVARRIESLTGKRIIPWDVISVDLVDKILSEELLSSLNIDKKGNVRRIKASNSYLDEDIVLNGETVKRKEIVRNLLDLAIRELPGEQMIYDLVVEKFNSSISNYNARFDKQIEDLAETITPENETEINTKIAELEKLKLNVGLDKFVESPKYAALKALEQPNIIAKQTELQLSDDEINALDGSTQEELSKVYTSYNQILQDFATKQNKDIQDLTDEEKIEALSEIVALYETFYPEDKVLSSLATSDNPEKFLEIAKIIDSFIPNREAIINKFKEFKEFRKQQYASIKAPEIFDIDNYAIDAIIKEIKDSKNLDKELLTIVQKTFYDLITSIKSNYLKAWTIDDASILNLLENIEKINTEFKTFVGEILAQGDSEIKLPKYLSDIVSLIGDDTDQLLDLEKDLSDLFNDLDKVQKTTKKLIELKEIIDNKDKFISNSIYDFLENFTLFLSGNKDDITSTVFKVLKNEELSLLSASEITNYISEGIRDIHIEQAINALKIAKASVLAMQTTEMDMEDPYGFIASRQAFVEKHKLDSEIKSLKTTDSATATLMMLDLDRVMYKLEFLRGLAKSNSGKVFLEQEITRSRTSELLLEEWKKLVNKGIKINEKPLIPDLSEILNSADTAEKKVLEIETAFYNYYKDSTLEEKSAAVKELFNLFKYTNILDNLYASDGSDIIGKDIKALSNNDFLMSLVASIALSSRDYNNKLLKILESDNFNKSPFYTQELGVKIAYASIIEPELFAQIAKDSQYINSLLTEYITYIVGDAGTGKTTALKLLLLMLKDNNPNLSVWFAAPHIAKTNELQKEIMDQIEAPKFDVKTKLNKQQLFEKLGIVKILEDINKPNSELLIKEDPNNSSNKEYVNIDFSKITFSIPSDLPNVILIDEITHFTAVELAVMNELIKRAKQGTETTPGVWTKIVGAGDPSQIGAIYAGYDNLSFNIDRVSGIYTPRLSIAVRSMNSQKRANNDHLSAITKKAVSVYETSEDVPKVLELISSGVLFKYFLDSETLSGDYLTNSNTIPEDILKTLGNIVKNNPAVTIGILSKGVEINPSLKESLNKVGITETNYKIYTEDNVQGIEEDYFIFNTSIVKAPNITRSLRKLYTYMSRAKQASIIINDAEIANEDKSIVKFISERQDFTELIDPIREDAIKEAKKSRIDSLKTLLDPDFNINDNFKFNPGEVIIDDDTSENNIFTGEFTQGTTDEEAQNDPKFKVEDNFNYRIHTFYNDLNISYKIEGNFVTLTRNPNSQISFGLDFLIKEGENSSTLSKSDFEKYTNAYIKLKHDIWDSKIRDKKFKLPGGNALIEKLVNGSYRVNDYKTELVLRKDNYDEEFNAPFAKLLDDKSKHHKDNTPYFNLFLKVNINKDTVYYVHLAQLSETETVKNWFGKDSNSNKQFEKFIASDITEIPIKSEQIEVRTSTRLVRDEKRKTVHTLKDLTKIPGLLFHNGSKFDVTPVYNIFPTGDAGFEQFKKIYRQFTFGKEIPATEEDKVKSDFTGPTLHDLYYGRTVNGNNIPGYKGKPYAVISFVNNPSQAQIILLKSKTRSFDDIIKTIKNPYNSKEPVSASKLIKQRDPDIHAFTDTLFSGSQILDLLISLAVDEPALFDKFFKNGTDILEKTAEGLSKHKEFILEYLSVFKGEFEKDLLSHITYSKSDSEDKLRDVFKLIRDTVAAYTKDNKPINKTALRKELLEKVRGNKLWFVKFWNFFNFRNTLDQIINNEEVLDDIRSNYRDFASTMDKIINYWKNKFPEGVYYNVPIQTLAGGGYQIKRTKFDLQYLYTNLSPEGLYANIDLSKEVNNEISRDEPEDKQVLLARKELDKLKIISYTKDDTLDVLKDKITRSKVIKNIVGHKNNKASFGNTYTSDFLVNMDLAELKNILQTLNAWTEKPSITELITSIENELDSLIKYENSPLKNLKQRISFLKDPDAIKMGTLTLEDEKILLALVEKWNVKQDFSGQLLSLADFLNLLETDPDEVAELINTENDEFFTAFLTSEIYSRWKIDSADLNRIITTNLFNNCLN